APAQRGAEDEATPMDIHTADIIIDPSSPDSLRAERVPHISTLPHGAPPPKVDDVSEPALQIRTDEIEIVSDASRRTTSAPQRPPAPGLPATASCPAHEGRGRIGTGHGGHDWPADNRAHRGDRSGRWRQAQEVRRRETRPPALFNIREVKYRLWEWARAHTS